MTRPDRHRRSCTRALARAAELVAALALSSGAAAGPLADPTRPPAARQPAPASARPATALRPAAAVALPPAPSQPAPAVVPPRLQVQSIQTGRQGSASALVEGSLVRVGDVLAGATVVAIDADGLTLRSAGLTRRLWLLDSATRQSPVHPGLPAGPVMAASAAASGAQGEIKSPVAALTGTQP